MEYKKQHGVKMNMKAIRIILVLMMGILAAISVMTSLASADNDVFDDVNHHNNSIYNVSNISAERFIGDGSGLTNVGIGDEADPRFSGNFSNGFTATVKPFTDSLFDLGTNILRWAVGYFDQVVATEGTFNNITSGNWSNVTIFESQILDLTPGGATTNIFDQDLNTTSNVTFDVLIVNSINSSDWTNITITESQISDLSHAQQNFFNQDLNTTSNVTFDRSIVVAINASDWSNVTINEAQVSDLTHIGNNGILLLEANITDLTHITNNGITLLEANITDLAHIGNDAITLNILNITGTDSNVCGNGDFVKNVTFDEGNLFIVCDTPAGGGNFNFNDFQDSFQINFSEPWEQNYSVALFSYNQSLNPVEVDPLLSANLTGGFDSNLTASVNNTLGLGNSTDYWNRIFVNVVNLITLLTDAQISDTLTLGSSSVVDKGALANTGTLGFDWADSEVADTLTIDASSTVADGALSVNVPLIDSANNFTVENTFFEGINVTIGSNVTVGNTRTWWNGSCLNTEVASTLVQSIGCI